MTTTDTTTTTTMAGKYFDDFHHHSPPPSESDPSSSSQYPTNLTYTHHQSRTLKDLPFLILFILFIITTFSFGIFASLNKNPNTPSSVTSFTYDIKSDSCISSKTNKDLIFNLITYDSNSSYILKNLVLVVVVTLILSIPICLFLLFSLKRYAKQLVYVSLPFFVIVPVLVNLYWFVTCTINATCSEKFPLGYRVLVLAFVFLVIGVIVWIFVLNWSRVELTVRIIKVSADALSNNLGLFWVLPGLVLGLVVYYVPIVVFLVFARLNGEIVPREKHGKVFCEWKQDGWVPAYYALAILTMLWSAAAMVEAQVYVISGTIAQWYFSKDDAKVKRGIRNSLRNAFGTSAGTICFSGILVAIVRIVRAAVDSAATEDASGIVSLVLRCCVNTFLSAFEFLNKFTINFAAITGEAYCASARLTYELLRRNLLSAVVVETVSTRLLAAIIFVLSAIYAIVVCVILQAATRLGVDSYFVAAVAFVVLILILGFLVHVLDNVIDTVYICYAIDRDKGEVCKADVHEIYVHLPISRNHNPAYLNARTPLLV
uniref:Choline transporter-like protein n=1 Tax=Tanacetum cinerariifolium TaxID=118510 RepID=A0A699HV00_TANCI|nr:CTL-like protein [Tanacetum cinerariifolium]GEY68575.1 CTL-like protein [Tanacetum cinerariifolium]